MWDHGVLNQRKESHKRNTFFWGCHILWAQSMLIRTRLKTRWAIGFELAQSFEDNRIRTSTMKMSRKKMISQ